MTFYEAAVEVLRQVGRPLHYKKITEFAVRRSLLSHVGKTPELSMANRLEQAVRKDRGDSAVVRTRPGVFALRVWGTGEQPNIQVAETLGTDSDSSVGVGGQPGVARGMASLTDRVVEVLETAGDEPMTPLDVSRILFGATDTLLRSSDPETAVRAALRVEDVQRLRAGRPPRFSWLPDGRVGLRKREARAEHDAAAALDAACAQLSAATHARLNERLTRLPIAAFEQLCLAVIRAGGWEQLALRSRQMDGSVLVTGEQRGRRLACQLFARGRTPTAGDIEAHCHSMALHAADVGWLLCYADVSGPVAAYAKTVDLRVTDREALLDRLVSLGLGVREVTVSVHVVDDEFLLDLEGRDG